MRRRDSGMFPDAAGLHHRYTRRAAWAKAWFHTTSGASLSCAHWAGRTRLPRATRAWRAVGNPREGPGSVRWVTFAIISDRISRRTTFW